MNAQLLSKLFGTDGKWRGPCTVIVDADANVQTIGSDSIVQGGLKTYSPRLITGRIVADSLQLLPEFGALLLIQKTVIRQQGEDDLIKTSLLVVDAGHVVAVEFAELEVLDRLGVRAPK